MLQPSFCVNIFEKDGKDRIKQRKYIEFTIV